MRKWVLSGMNSREVFFRAKGKEEVSISREVWEKFESPEMIIGMDHDE